MNLDSLLTSMTGPQKADDSKLKHIEEVYTKLAAGNTSLTKEQVAYMLYGPAGLELMGVDPDGYKFIETPMGKGLSFNK